MGQPVQILEVENVEMGEVVIKCNFGDESVVERVADFLSCKGYPEAAMQVRELVCQARKGVIR